MTAPPREKGRRFYASVPEARGSRRRAEVSFAAEGERDAWLSAAVAAVQAGCPPPDPRAFRHRPPTAADDEPRPLFEVL